MPVPARRSASRLSSALLVAAVAAAAYVNTLPAQFTFDDAFAIVHNADVTDLSKPLRSIFRNDFWGQDLASPMSHKSYRPLATLSFRAQHWLASSLGRGRDAAEAEQAEGDGQQAQQGRLQASRRPTRPFVFHLTNVAVHALVTALVYRLACQLVAARQLGASPLPVAAAVAHAAGSKGGAQASSSVGSGIGIGIGSDNGAGFAISQANLEPLLAALLFAVHPVHTEAVAGIVGHAELLCAALSIPALLAYMAAADGRASGLASHWRHVGAAVLLGWAAALSKEIGITIMGAMLCYDALVSPMAFQLQPPQLAGTVCRQQRRHQQQGLVEKEKQQGLVPQASSGRSAKLASAAPTARLAGRDAMPAAAVAAAATELLLLAAANSSSSDLALASSVAVSAARRRGLKLKLQRMAVAVAAVLLYVGGRAWLAGDQLVRIYRKVENPVPFAASSLTRKLTTGYLHARYAGLLVAPLQLSADWSYACIEYVSSLSDPRNLATAALYAALLAILLAAQPWQVLLEWAGYRNEAPSAAPHARRWRLAVTAGLLVGPFFPASNVLFYVGTFIGERLLYVPSIGYCILIAQPLAAALQLLLDQRMRGSCSTTGNSCSTAADGGGTARGRHVKLRSLLCGAAALVLAAMLCFFTAKTVLRNLDWLDEERLFTAAQKVCWRSGKVQLNSGIIERRYERMAKAESHFLLAQAADPDGFCEPQYHIALTLLNRNLTRAVEYLERGVACKYTAADSVKALNQIYLQLMERTPERSAAFTERWAAVLARPELQRFTEAATYFESAAAKAQTPVVAAMMLNRAQSLLQEAQPVAEGRTPDHPVRVLASRHQLDLLLRCMVARRPVILAMLSSGGNLQTREVKQAAYSYLNTHGEECRQPMAVEPGAGVEDQAARSSTYHTALMHALQEGDVNDPWLQQEWGLMLVAAGRVQEALAHLEVAGHIFAAQLQPPSKGLQRGVVLDRQGRRAITEEEAAAAAVRAYQHARAAVEVLTAAPDGRLDPAARRRVLCHLLQQECGVAHQQVERSKLLHSNPGAHRTAAAAKLLSQCLAEGRALGCTALQFGDSGGSNRAGSRSAAAKDEL